MKAFLGPEVFKGAVVVARHHTRVSEQSQLADG